MNDMPFDLANIDQGLRGCDAVYPYDVDQAYRGLHQWTELLIAERRELIEQLEAAQERLGRTDSLAPTPTVAWSSSLRSVIAGSILAALYLVAFVIERALSLVQLSGRKLQPWNSVAGLIARRSHCPRNLLQRRSRSNEPPTDRHARTPGIG